MIISYCFSSSDGDVILDDAALDRPFAIGPSEYHPFMTLRDFFEAVRDALIEKGASPLVAWLSRERQRPVTPSEIERLVIRYEKYGTLYQVCSVDITSAGSTAKICATLARSDQARKTLEREFSLLERFRSTGPVTYLPCPLFRQETEVSRKGSKETILIAFLEWFDDYHEWHFSRLSGGSTRAYIWDMKNGYRLASENETHEIVRQASRILCLCYDMATSSRVTPWHHGAGDFVVSILPEDLDVKLVTIRGYEPATAKENRDAVAALLGFFLTTVTKMRLDKWEGMGESTWADSAVVRAALEGFLEGVRIKESRGEMSALEVREFLSRLRSLTIRDVNRLLHLQLDELRAHDLSDYWAIRRHLDDHAVEIHHALQAFFSPPSSTST